MPADKILAYLRAKWRLLFIYYYTVDKIFSCKIIVLELELIFLFSRPLVSQPVNKIDRIQSSETIFWHNCT